MPLEGPLRTALRAARLSGLVINRELRSMDDSQNHRMAASATKSNETDIVTKTDLECEAIISSELRKDFPGCLIIGEESTAEAGHFDLTTQSTWTIDPVDGTVNFTRGIPVVTTLISRVTDKVADVGVILDPIHAQVFFGTKDGGAWVQDLDHGTLAPLRDRPARRLRTSGARHLKDATVIMDIAYKRDQEEVDRYLQMQRNLLVQERTFAVRTLGSCGLEMAYVAAGRLDAYFETEGPSLWDFSPGSLLIREAGGCCRDPRGSSLDLSGHDVLAAASVELADELTHAIVSGLLPSKKKSALGGDSQ